VSAAYRTHVTGTQASGTFVDVTTTGAGIGSTDTLWLIVFSDTADISFNTPSGWTARGTHTAPSSHSFAVFSRTLSAAPDTTYTVTRVSTGAIDIGAVLIALNPDTDIGPPAITFTKEPAATAGGTVTNTQTISFTGAADPAVLLCAWINDTNNSVTTPPTGMTAIVNHVSSTAGCAVYYQNNPGSGALSKSLTWGGTTDNTYAVALLAAYTAGGGGGATYKLKKRLLAEGLFTARAA
jgi:hypothetical protein